MDLKQVFEQRRSVNFFDTTQKLDKAVLKKIVDLAATAPSAFNLQPWELLVVESEEAKQKLYALSNNQPKILEAPVTLVVIGDYNGYALDNPEWEALGAMMGGMDAIKGYIDFAGFLYGSSELRKAKFAESNGGLFAMSLMYAAEYYGVKSHPMSGVDFDGIKAAFELGEGKEVVMVIPLGYFDESKQLYPRRNRKGYDQLAKEV